ncbi:hypothetical protein FRC01_008969 [Tulasnella sp. 417]|nr:hypothetical protein FRC01_008969 [Tulasnella sp. 417]
MTGWEIRDAQRTAARAVIPVLLQNRNEEEGLAADTEALLRDIEDNPLPTSAKGLSTGEMLDVIERLLERGQITKRLEERSTALAAERAEALSRLQPAVALAGRWLEAHGPKPRQSSSTAGLQVNIKENPEAVGNRLPKAHLSTERSDRSSEEAGERVPIDCTAKEGAVLEGGSSGSLDLEDQSRQLQQKDEALKFKGSIVSIDYPNNTYATGAGAAVPQDVLPNCLNRHNVQLNAVTPTPLK